MTRHDGCDAVKLARVASTAKEFLHGKQHGSCTTKYYCRQLTEMQQSTMARMYVIGIITINIQS